MVILLPVLLIAAMIAFLVASIIRFFLRNVAYQTIWNAVFVVSVIAVLLLILMQPSAPTEPQSTPSPSLTRQNTSLSELEQLKEERAYEATAEAIEELRRYQLFQEDQAELGLSDCTCQYNAYNCADFAAGNDAQACYQHCLNQTGSDVHWLDDDKDGLACDWAPRE